MGLIDENTKEKLKNRFGKLKDDVQFLVFVDPNGTCQFCAEAEELAKELASVSDKIKLKIFRKGENDEIFKEYKIDRTPAYVLHGKEKRMIRFFGIPAGMEFTTLIADIEEISKGEVELPPDFVEKIKAIDYPVKLMVFITLTCPYCPQAVKIAHSFALLNPNITGDMIEAQEFMDLAQKYQVSGVPKTVINDVIDLVGAYPPEGVLRAIESLKKG